LNPFLLITLLMLRRFRPLPYSSWALIILSPLTFEGYASLVLLVEHIIVRLKWVLSFLFLVVCDVLSLNESG
jgi:hypothetical protein